ncbi:MAG: tRNA epoxyqueuosine(34) reductase QueG, partial [Spirochaetaceae bacterium]|nr:tRNA epoxyqueuosine(34) reductase QueG [Spirochaetaceae bacterium]
MNALSMSEDYYSHLFAQEGLIPPGILSRPLSGKAEEDRLHREAAFKEGLGNHPPQGLDWIRFHSASKYRPDRIVEGCRSVLVTALNYYREDEIISSRAWSRGRIARYARGRDYHKELGNRLKRIVRKLESSLPGENFRAFTDIGPLDETWLVQASGLGFKGRHTLAILPELGTWVVLGHIVSTYPFQAAADAHATTARCPEGCTRCIDACPAGALSLPGRLDASRCISYQTIEHKGSLDKKLLPLPEVGVGETADRVFGCDACQEACPFNSRVKETQVEAFRRDIAGASRSLKELLALKTREDVLERFAGSPLMRAGRNSLVRNACIAAGNSRDTSLLPELLQLSKDKDEG